MRAAASVLCNYTRLPELGMRMKANEDAPDEADAWLAAHDPGIPEPGEAIGGAFGGVLNDDIYSWKTLTHRPFLEGRYQVSTLATLGGTRRGATCDGCRGAMWPDCAACGEPATVALPEPDPDCKHIISLCDTCYAVVLAARQPAQKPPAPSKYTTRKRRGHYTADELAHIVERRDNAGWTWQDIAKELNANHGSIQKAYKRETSRRKPQPVALSAVPAADSEPEQIPKKRQRPALLVPMAATAQGTRQPSPTVHNLGNTTALRAPSRVSQSVESSRAVQPTAPSTEDKAMRLPASRGNLRSTGSSKRKVHA